jgi:hypothetical protein
MGGIETATNRAAGAHAVPETYQQELRERVASMLNLSPGQASRYTLISNTTKLFRFPGAQPISLVGSSLVEFEKRDWFVSEKSDGTRYLMYITLTPTPNREMTQEVFLVRLLDRT